MIKYITSSVTFQEVPNEVSLVFQITQCPNRCEGCHSPYLRDDIGVNLEADLPMFLEKYRGAITCVCFMGTGNDGAALERCLQMVRAEGVKTAIYCGDDLSTDLFSFFEAHLPSRTLYPDYIKVGSYQAALGGLCEPTTNQRMWRHMKNGEYEDITSFFWQKGDGVS